MRKIIFTAILCITFFACANESENEKNQQSTPANSTLAIDGKNLFQANCASCHHPTKPMTGPALKGVLTRVPNKQWIYDFVHNSTKVIASGDEYALNVFKNNGGVVMTNFPNLSNEEIDAILNYCEE